MESTVPMPSGGKATEWKVRVASLASFVGATVAGLLLESRGPQMIEQLPSAVQVLAGAVLAAALTWLSGRAARSRPEYISQSTIDAVRARARLTR